MKRYIVAAGVGSLVFAAAVGSASMLSVDPGVAQSGHEYLRGDSNGVVIDSWGWESDDDTSRFVRVQDVDPSLAGKTLWAQAYNQGGDRIGRGDAPISDTGEVVVRWAAPVDVEAVESVRLTIE